LFIKKVLYICLSLTIKNNNNMDTTDKFLQLKNELQNSSINLETFNKFSELTSLFFQIRHEKFVEGLHVAKEIYTN